MTSNKESITVELRRATSWTRHPCLFCGGTSDKEMVIAEVILTTVNMQDGHTSTVPTRRVACARCLDRDREGLIREILESASWHREQAAVLEAIAADLPVLPSRLEYDAANEAANREFENETSSPAAKKFEDNWFDDHIRAGQ